MFTCWERADLLACLYMYVKLSCVSVTFPFDVLGQVWYLIASIPDLCLLTNFILHHQVHKLKNMGDGGI